MKKIVLFYFDDLRVNRFRVEIQIVSGRYENNRKLCETASPNQLFAIAFK